MSIREKLGLGAFVDFCSERPHAGNYQALCDLWASTLQNLRSDPVVNDITSLIKYGMLVVHYEPGVLASDDHRAREYLSAFVHRDRFDLLKEMAEGDEDFEYIFTDAEEEVKLASTDKTSKDNKHRKPVLIAEDDDYHVYAFLHFPIGPLFDLKEAVANDILNNFVYVQVMAREYRPSSRVVIWWKCLLERVIKNTEVDIQSINDVHGHESSEQGVDGGVKVRN